MDKLNISQHISAQFNAELEDVRNRVLAMGGLVEQQIGSAMRALVECDVEEARAVVNNDTRVNAMEVAIDEECSRVLARRQPAASDLRLLMAVIKTITDLERIGDEAERIARMTGEICSQADGRFHHDEVRHLGEMVRGMLHDALDAFARLDDQAALSTARKDRQIDREYESILRQLITHMMEDPRHIRRALSVTWAARSLERIGDHSKNICEYVIYLVKGKDVRHTGIEHTDPATAN
jgi:phosphate transport system protein